MSLFTDHKVWHLTRAFTARFFENEITEGADDLKASFFWLVAFLAPIGFLIPWFMSFGYQVVFLHRGVEALREVSRSEKALYLGLSMIAAGALSIVSWNAMLTDRRDAYVLGVLPLSGRAIVLAKLAGLGLYVSLVAVGMHTAGSLSFGLILSIGENGWFAIRGVLAHFVASCFASAFTFLSIATLQAIVLVVVGPKLFSRISSVLQLTVAAITLGAFLVIPAVALWATGVGPGGDGGQSWVLWTPPVWFLGLYESIVGTSNPLWHGLALTSLIALGVLIVVSVIVYPFAYRKVIEGAIESTDGRSRLGWEPRLAAFFERRLAIAPKTRAAVQFFFATCSRVPRQRLTLAVSAGITFALLLPASLEFADNFARTAPRPPVAVLSAAMTVMLLALVGFRLAAALPADVRASWLFALLDDDRRAGRIGLGRTMLALGVLPATIVAFVLVWYGWDLRYALMGASIEFSVGLLLIEALLWNYGGMPCSKRWNPGTTNLRTWWPAYLVSFYLVTQALPRLSVALHDSVATFVAVVVPIVVLAVLTHLRATKLAAGQIEEDVP